MTPEEAASSFLLTKLQGRAGLVALLATVPTWGASVWPEEMPEGDQYLNAVVFRQGEGRDIDPMGKRSYVALPFLVDSLAEGTVFPHNIAAEADAALHQATGVIGGYAITCRRLGGGRPSSSNTGKRRYRTVPGRYLVELSPSQ